MRAEKLAAYRGVGTLAGKAQAAFPRIVYRAGRYHAGDALPERGLQLQDAPQAGHNTEHIFQRAVRSLRFRAVGGYGVAGLGIGVYHEVPGKDGREDRLFQRFAAVLRFRRNGRGHRLPVRAGR